MPLEHEGDYEGRPISHALLPQSKMGSIGISIGWLIVKAMPGTPPIPDDVITMESAVYVTGRLRQRLPGWDQLVDVLGWSGKFTDVVEGGGWKPGDNHAKLTIKWDEYKGERRLKVDRIGHLDGHPVKRSGAGMKEAALYDEMIAEGPLAEPIEPKVDGGEEAIPF